MSVPNSMVVDTAKAREIWVEYQRQHDVSDRKGQAVGAKFESLPSGPRINV